MLPGSGGTGDTGTSTWQNQREDGLTYNYTGVHYAQTSDWFEVWARKLSNASGVVVVFSQT